MPFRDVCTNPSIPSCVGEWGSLRNLKSFLGACDWKKMVYALAKEVYLCPAKFSILQHTDHEGLEDVF